jgi:DNA polymerase-3 subunit epsilon
MFAIIDIETTGGNSRNDRITEIAIFVHDGERVVAEYDTLINPECKIPYYISELTGIYDHMVANAPKFYQVAKKIVEITEGCTFVAHNAKFDYNFIRNEFKSLGFDYTKTTLCTVQLSRKLLPGHASYSLGKLTKDLGIDLHMRHRAGGDAAATVKLFELLLQKDGNGFRKLRSKATPGIAREWEQHHLRPIVESLPEKTGVYYFFNDAGELVYVGKSLNIRSRVTTHMANYTTQKSVNMRNAVASIKYELTGSELVALLMESAEIKRHQPIYNQAQRRASYEFGLMASMELDGYIRLQVDRVTKQTPLTTFTTRDESKVFIERLIEEFSLCPKLTALEFGSGPCFNHSIHKCYGACIGLENPDVYNKRIEDALRIVRYDHEDFLVIDQGRYTDERSVVFIAGGRYMGYGFVPETQVKKGVEHLKSCISPQQNNRNVQSIIKGYLERNAVQKLIPL